MKILFCGVRGSTPVSGREFNRIGGNTSCVAVARDGEHPTLVLDAGTGLRRLAAEFPTDPFRGTILLTHLHWDHVQGLPFFPPADRDDARVQLVQPAQGDPYAVLARAMSPPHFPIEPAGLRGEWQHDAIEPGTHVFAGFDVLAREVPHKGGRTFGYRISDGSTTIAYVPDHGPHDCGASPDGHGERHDAALALADQVDILIHGAQFLDGESEIAREYGHATVDYAVALAEAAGARRLLLFHHSPGRTDDAVEAIATDWNKRDLDVVAASEGLTIST